MKLLISFGLIAVVAQTNAQTSFEPITVTTKPSTSNETKKVGVALGAADEDTTSGGVSSGSDGKVTRVANRIGGTISSAVNNPFGAGGDSGRDVSDSLGSFSEGSIGFIAEISRSITDPPGERVSNSTAPFPHESQNASGSAASIGKGIREAVGSFVSDPTGIASNMGKNIANTIGGGALMSRQPDSSLPDSLKNSTGSVREEVRKLDEAMRQGSTVGILTAAGSTVFRILVENAAGRMESADSSKKISDVGNLVLRALQRSLRKAAVSSSVSAFMPGAKTLDRFLRPFAALT